MVFPQSRYVDASVPRGGQELNVTTCGCVESIQDNNLAAAMHTRSLAPTVH